MNYRQLQTALKNYRDQGYTVPKLNSKKAVLEAALKEIEGKMTWEEMLNDSRTMEAMGRVVDAMDKKVKARAAMEAETERFLAGIGLNELYAECEKRGFHIEGLLAEEARHQSFLENISTNIPVLA